MTDPINMAAPASSVTTPRTPDDPEKIKGAAKQFEALMIAQMLRTARENTEDDDSTASSMLDLADQQFSQVLANNGGLGLSNMIVKGINQGQINADQQSSPNK